MSSLFSKSAIRQAISSFQGHDLSREIAIVSELYEDFRKGNMKDETRYEQNFNELFFHQLLGYDPKINLHPKASTPVGSKIADVGLGFFEDGLYSYEGVKVVVELKGCDTLLDKKQASYGGQSPVDQGFGYKTSFKDCPWLIVSNFASVRLYRDNKQDFEVWTIEDLANPDNEYYNLKTLLGLLKRNHLISQSSTSFSEKLLSEVRIKQEQITKDFYKQYKTLRFELINDIRHNNPATHVETVVEKAQKIIDRIIFIHFCEDKGLLPEGKLKTNVIRAREADFSPWDVLKKYFKGVDSGSEKLEIPHGYNGGLFHEDPVLNNLEIGDAICHKFIDLGNYSFDDELSVNILGHIFEQSISDIEQLKGELISDLSSGAKGSDSEMQSKDLLSTTIKDPSTRSGGQKEEKKESKRKKDGIFYTPEYIVDYIVQNSLMVYLEEKENECLAKYKKEIEAYQAYQHILHNIKVLDPACGSGAFLVRVFDYLYAENKRVGQIVKSLFDDDEIYKSILRNNIYGVDLNPESVEITKLSLWLKSAQKGKKLNNLDDNIKCGNSLIDDPAVAGDRAFDRKKEFSDIMGAGGFDVIVGNPPYVNIKGIDENSRNFFFSSGLFKVATYKTDLYALFTERSLKLLKNKGFLGFIMPYSRLSSSSFESLRRFIFEDNIIKKLDIFGQGIFQDANILTAISIIKKEKMNLDILLGDYRNTKTQNLATSLGNQEKKTISLDFIKNSVDFSIPIDIQSNDYDIIKKIESKGEKIFDFIVDLGMNTADDKKYLYNEIVGLKNPKKVIEGKDFGRYFSKWNGLYVDYIPEEMIKNKLTARPGEPERFEIDKIILYRFINKDNKLTATFDSNNYYTLGSTYVIRGDFNKLKYLLTLLNSSLIGFYISKVFSGSKVTKNELQKIPLCFNNQQPFIDKADLMLSLNKELHDKTDSFLRYISSKFGLEKLSTKLQKFTDHDLATFLKELKGAKLSMSEEAELMEFFETKKSEIVSLKNRIDNTDREIDEMVFELYGLSEEERGVVMGE